jgi:hypothetical protein
MLRIATLVIAVLASAPVVAQEVSEEAHDLIDCGVTFLVHSDALRESGDATGADDFGARGEGLVGRGAEILVADGFDTAGIEDVLANLTLRASFLYPGDEAGMVARCEEKAL